MKKIVLIALTTLLGACSTLPEKTISGTFKGTLPCADCQKIDAELILNKDKTYEYNTVYFKNKKQHPFSEKGAYIWDKNKADVIHLQPGSTSEILLKVSDNYVEICDENGEAPQNNQYKLLKTAP
ncbi:hypothetical protein A6B43_06800 [Vespertiliibacter pulmonis]|uniref:NlpE-like protein n=1 Tax=Vespertiliibacter pulmonis TaxID=1443036 RepID=A0A3N4VZZ6_9PAST|nr:copper resistance protein NlpE [Vespertiliibacter pulmonis]QLB21245.1 hypothetical protein A6B43_06800 [Vespertiliibacter pulmonis]RPE85649.1 NlpE-like protein [Vespertiliibacter pulmonis]